MNKENKIGLIIMVMALIFITFSATRNLINQHWEAIMLHCTAGQDLTLRETNGTATFDVQFRDGEFDSFTCTSVPQTVD